MNYRLPDPTGHYGRLDAASAEMLRRFGGNAAVLLIVNVQNPAAGGFSLSTVDLNLAAKLPELLRNMADTIEAQLKAAQES